MPFELEVKMPKENSSNGSTKPIAFVAMCFDGRLQHVYHKVVKPVLENHEFSCVRADEIGDVGVIMDQIRDAIKKAELIICDLTFENPINSTARRSFPTLLTR